MDSQVSSYKKDKLEHRIPCAVPHPPTFIIGSNDSFTEGTN